MTYKQAIKKAKSAFGNQKTRCNNPKCERYEFYGAKGIRVKYTWEEFSNWYLDNIKLFKGKKPSVGRIDHNKNYTLDNIEIQSIFDNVSDRNDRHGPPTQRIAIVGINTITGKKRLFESSYWAEHMTRIPNAQIIKKCTNPAVNKWCKYFHYKFSFYEKPNVT